MPTGQLDEARPDWAPALAMRRDDTIGSSRSFSLPITSVGTVRLSSAMCLRAERVDQRAGPAAAAGRRGGGEQLVDEIDDRRVGVAAHRHRRHEPRLGPVDRAQQRCRAERLQQRPRRAHPDVGERRRHRQQLDVAQQVAGGGVDQRDGVGALGHPLAGSAPTTTVIAMPPIECPAMTARSPGASVASSTASRSAARWSRL